jgi:hypothetical protein
MAGVKEFLSFDELIYGIKGLGPATVKAMEETIAKLAPKLEKEIKKQIGAAVGKVDPSFGWPPLAVETILAKERAGLGKGGDPFTMLYGTGDFYRSIKVKVSPKDLSIHIGSDVQQAVYTEFGTTRQPARPVFRPAAAKAVEKFRPIFEAAIKKNYADVFSRVQGHHKRFSRYEFRSWPDLKEVNTLTGAEAAQGQ